VQARHGVPRCVRPLDGRSIRHARDHLRAPDHRGCFLCYPAPEHPERKRAATGPRRTCPQPAAEFSTVDQLRTFGRWLTGLTKSYPVRKVIDANFLPRSEAQGLLL